MIAAACVAGEHSAGLDANSPDAGPTLAGAPCPPEPVLELLHDALFHIERGDDDARVRSEIARIRQMTKAQTVPAAFLARVQAALESDGGRRLDAEQLRAELHLSGCIPEDVHQRFHQALPPVR